MGPRRDSVRFEVSRRMMKKYRSGLGVDIGWWVEVWKNICSQQIYMLFDLGKCIFLEFLEALDFGWSGLE
jgi:hypothetical protein